MKDIAAQFKKPDSQYRGKPFWAWNGKMSEEEVRSQLQMMKKMGLGGAFMHSRVGLDTPYMSEEWMKVIKAGVDECRKLDMEAWLYDEDRWPSGAAGGLVTSNRKYSMRCLNVILTTSSKYVAQKGDLAVFSINIKKDKLISYNRLKGKSCKGIKGKIAVFRSIVHESHSWFNGQTYLDTMNREAVAEFIKVTHEAYKETIGGEFGKLVPGIFTDEPNYNHSLGRPECGRKTLPWTDKLPAIFRKRYRYDILDCLPELFFDLEKPGLSKVLWSYRDCVTHLFVSSFAEQIGAWCEKNKLLFTGHVLEEEPLRGQARVSGSAMRFYEYMQAPGIDILTDSRMEFDTVKQCSSVLHQTGRKWLLSETNGCTGWDFSLEGHKWVSDWQAALGVNLRCQHLYWYTMLGEAKRDYPASIGHQSPWWESYSLVEDYFARINLLLTQGKSVQKILVIHPQESVWCCEGKQKEAELLVDSFHKLRDSLLSSHLDFDYGDEEMLSRLGKVTKDPGLKLGKAVYDVVIVPELLTMRSSTVKILKNFMQRGGKVIFAGKIAGCVDAELSPAVEDISLMSGAVKVKGSGRALVSKLEDYRTVSIADSAGIEIKDALYQMRRCKDKTILFVCNKSRTKEYKSVIIKIAGKAAEEWDLLTGSRFAADASTAGKSLKIDSSLPASGSRMFIVYDNKIKLPSKLKTQKTVSRQSIKQKLWTIQRNEPNVMVLDYAEWKLGSDRWQKKEEILKIDHACRDRLGIARRGGKMVQPWAADKKNLKSVPLQLRYKVDVKTPPAGPVSLGIEQPGAFKIILNGEKIYNKEDSGWWCDKSLRKININPSLFIKGENVLLLQHAFSAKSKLESLFLLGEFGVSVKGGESFMAALPQQLKVGSWVKQGLPFYSGSVTYLTSVRKKIKKNQKLFLKLPGWKGSCVRIFIDGRMAGTLGWQPHEVDLTPFINSDTFDLGIEIISHRRNSHGPLHHAEPYPDWTGPDQFVTTGIKWDDRYMLVPVGLTANPVLSVRT
ncbi:MAG: glycosyl hydrolase [Planctomycetota bacterium]|jgi:hypothetical protein